MNRIEKSNYETVNFWWGKLNQAGRSPPRYTSTFGGNRKGGHVYVTNHRDSRTQPAQAAP